MSARAISYITSVVIVGAAVLAGAILNWSSENLAMLLALLLLTAILSTMKVTLPRVTGTISGGFLPVLVGIALLTSSQVVLLAAVSALVQSMWKSRVRPQAVQVAFNVAVLSVSAFAAWQAAHATPLNLIGLVSIAVIVNYVLDVTLVSTVLCLIENKPLTSMLQNCNFWSLPYYFGGALIAAAVAGSGSNPYWSVVLPAIAMMYAVYRFYSEYVNVLAKR